MKLITLNIWGGNIHGPLLKFLSNNQNIDIFCFQEVFHGLNQNISTTDFIFEDVAHRELFTEIQSILVNFNGYFCPVHTESYGLAIFVKKDISVKEFGDVLLYKNDKYDPKSDDSDHNRKLQWLKISKNNCEYVVMNVHGHWSIEGKIDNQARLIQSKEIKNLLKLFNNSHKILCGDFNLRPDTDSIKILEEGMVNLVTKHGIKSTRTNLYKKPEKFADYIFVSPNINVKDFKVLSDEVSDHSPLFIDFDVM